MKSGCICSIMDWFSKNKGKKSPDTRGLCDSHSLPNHVSSHVSLPLVPVTSHVSASTSSAAAFSSPPIAMPYEVPPQVAGNRGTLEVNFFAGGNMNKAGIQEIDDVEVGNSANGVISPLFANDGGKFDIKVGNNFNEGDNQKVGKVRFGNAS